MSKILSISLCVLLILTFATVESKRGGGRKPSGSSSGGLFSSGRRQQSSGNKASSSTGQHSGQSQHFLDKEKQHTDNRGHIGFENFNKPPPAHNPAGLGFGNQRQPSAPPAGGIGSAFGSPPRSQNTHVQSAPYPNHNNPGFGGNPHSAPYPTHNNPGGFGGAHPNPAPYPTHNNPGGFGNPHPNPGFGGASQYPHGNPAGFGSVPGSNTHYSQPGFGNTGHNQPNYGGGYQGSHYPNSGQYHPAGQPGFGHAPNNYGGHGYQNPGGYHPSGGSSYGGGHPSGGYSGGHYSGYPSGGYQPGGFGGAPIILKQQSSGPGLGTGLLGGLAGGALLGYGLHSLTHSSSSSPTPYQNTPAQHQNDEAFNIWLRERAEERNRQIAANSTAAGSSGSGTGLGTGTFDPSKAAHGQGATTTTNQTAIVNDILDQNKLCPGSAGILDTSVINTLVPCNITQVDYNEMNFTEPIGNDCKTVTLDFIQLNTDTNENKTVNVKIRQNNSTGNSPYLIYTYDIDFVSCIHPLYNPDGKTCVTKSFSADKLNQLNETFVYLHTANITLLQYNTTLYENGSCAQTGACGPDNKPPRNVTSAYLSFSVLPTYPASISMSQCLSFPVFPCPFNSTEPCDAKPYFVKQTIKSNSTLSKSDFANINFLLHETPEIFTAFIPQQEASTNGASASTLTGDGLHKSSASAVHHLTAFQLLSVILLVSVVFGEKMFF